jgi:EAL domain-containing protein (putative c-di-GMP-specific phosphodiesterase class I)
LAVALDDFGTGYSSLAHLKRLPLDIVKIDHAFIAGIPGDPQDEAIVEAIIQIGSRFGFAIVAEGVESEEQLSFLRRAGCAYAQGYLFARPMPAEAFDAWLTRHHAARGRLAL